MSDLSGIVLSSYKILRELGRGAMGVVFQGAHVENGSFAAIKVMDTAQSPVDAGADERRRRFTDEITALSSVKSPHVVKILAFGNDPRLGSYLVLEYLDGKTLEEALAGGLTFQGEDFLEKLAVPLLDGLSALHNRKIAHRDIKPSNLISRACGTFLISDFGLASFSGRMAKTKTGMVIGSPGYMAPEAFSGTSSPGGKSLKDYILSDIYSAGIVLTTVLAGGHPFKGKNFSETLQRQLRYDPSPKSLRDLAQRNGRYVDSETSEVLSKAMLRDPRKRFQSAQEVLSALKIAVLKAQSCTAESGCSSSETLHIPTSALTDSGAFLRSQSVSSVPSPGAWGVLSGSSSERLSRRTFFPVVLCFVILVILACRFWGTKDPSVSLNESLEDILLEDQSVHRLFSTYISTGKQLMADEILPSVDVLKIFYENGTGLFSRLNVSSTISSRNKSLLWEKANADLEGFPLLLSNHMARYVSKDDKAYELAILAHSEFRSTFEEYIEDKNNYSTQALTTFLRADRWFLEVAIQSAVEPGNADVCFPRVNDLITNSEYFLGKILPPLFDFSSKPPSKNVFPVRQMWDSIALVRVELFLRRAALFGGRFPVSPWKKLDESVFQKYTSRQRTIVRDGANGILRGLKYVYNRKTAGSPQNKDIASDLALLSGLLLDDESLQRSVKDINKRLRFLQKSQNMHTDRIFKLHQCFVDTDPVFSGEFDGEGYDASIERLSEYMGALRSIESDIRSLFQFVTGLGPSGDSTQKKERQIFSALIAGQRVFWFFYPVTVLRDTFVIRDNRLDSFQPNFAYFVSSLIPFIEGREPMDAFINREDISPAMDPNLLTAVPVITGESAVKFVVPEQMWGLEQSVYTSDTLSFHLHLMSVFNKCFHDFAMFSTTKDEKFKGILKLFNSRWDESILPYIQKRSFLYTLLNSNRLLIHYGGENSERVEKALNLTLKAFNQARKEIAENGEVDAPYHPYIELISEIIDIRWDYLRRFKRINVLKDEAQWVLDLLDPKIIEQAKRMNEGRRIRLYGLAACNLGHAFLVEKDRVGVKNAERYLRRARSIIDDPESALYPKIEHVLAGNTLY